MGLAIKVTLYILGILFLIGGLISVSISQGAQDHTQVNIDPLSGEAVVYQLSYSEILHQFFGDYYSVSVHFKTSNGVVVDVFLTDPKYVDEYSSGSGMVHYYKHLTSDEGILTITLPANKKIAIVVINKDLSSTMVNLDLTTNISDTLFGGGIFAIVLGIALIASAYFHKTHKKTFTTPKEEYAPPPPIWQSEESEQHVQPTDENKESILPTKEPVIKYCPNCGHEVKPEWKVCPYCGYKLKGD